MEEFQGSEWVTTGQQNEMTGKKEKGDRILNN